MKHVIFGDEKGQHLFALFNDGDVVLVSHELDAGLGLGQWRDRVVVAMPLESWVAVGKVVEEGGPGPLRTGTIKSLGM